MKTISLILLKPEIINSFEDLDKLKEIQSDDIEPLIKVIELAKTKPSSSANDLRGRLYAMPNAAQLIKLLDTEKIIPNEGIEKEFNEAIARLLSLHRRQQERLSKLETAREKLLSRRQNSKNGSNTGNVD